MSYQVIQGSAHHVPGLADRSVHVICTSPPYMGLRSYDGDQSIEWPTVEYSPMPGLPPIRIQGCDPGCVHEWGNSSVVEVGRNDGGRNIGGKGGNYQGDGPHKAQTTQGAYCIHCGGWRGGLGLESSVESYIGHLILCLKEWHRILRDDGVCFVNLGDSYAGSGGAHTFDHANPGLSKSASRDGAHKYKPDGGRATDKKGNGLRPKSLMGVPWRFAFAAQADGWILRNDIIWCLSGGTWVYARTQKGDMPVMIRDLARLNPATVKLWNGEKWTQLLGMSKTGRDSSELEIVLRSGERISCTPTHKFPTRRGLLTAGDLRIGDILQRVRLPEPEVTKDSLHISLDAAWLAGLYIAEGSRAGDTIQIAGHANEEIRWERVRAIAQSYGGSATRTVDGNEMDIRIYGKVLNAIIDTLVTGEDAKTKGIAPVCWRYSNAFLLSLLDGYLSGDAHHDTKNNRWRLGFTRNYNLERDLRTICARLGFKLKLQMSSVLDNGKDVPTFRGEIRMIRSGHFAEKDTSEIVEIRKSRCREVYDLGVEDEPHVFALASGILTHNSKPNPMPESVTDRCTKAHEYIFMLAKREDYYFDAEAIKEPYQETSLTRIKTGWNGNKKRDWPGDNHNNFDKYMGTEQAAQAAARGANKRSVWTVATQPFSGAHFACWPEKLVEPMIKAGSSQYGCCAKCGAPWERVVEREVYGRNDRNTPDDGPRDAGIWSGRAGEVSTHTTGWRPTCSCQCDDVTPCVVLDPFVGSGTTIRTALSLGRNAIGVDMSDAYLGDLVPKRASNVQMQLAL